jgi:hypothetical protein
MMFKFDLGQVIWYLGPKGVHSAPVLARMRCENLHPEYAANQAQRELYTPWGQAGTWYQTCHVTIEENQCFGSREELGQAIARGDV